MQIDNLMPADGSQDYYDQGLRNSLEAHLSYLRNSKSTVTQPVDQHQVIVYHGDLFGYLTKANVKACYHWVVMRLNSMHSPRDFDETFRTLLVPDERELERLRMSWKATQKINS